MGRPAEQIEALQARVRELEGRCRAVTERASAAVELLRMNYERLLGAHARTNLMPIVGKVTLVGDRDGDDLPV